jgi:altronate dehydratase small subunit
MENVLVLSPLDNVGNAIENVALNQLIFYKSENNTDALTANQVIPFGFKVALRSIKKGEPVIKYGSIIGRATEDIQPGDLVHVHNLAGCRGRGDLEKTAKG